MFLAHMGVTQKEIDKIVAFVRQEPRTIQEIAHLIERSWVTADSYVKEIQDSTGQVNIKVFRKGTHGATKIAYYNYSESLLGDAKKEELLNRILNSRRKQDFDFLEIFQFVPDDKKKAFFEEYKDPNIATSQKVGKFLRNANHSVTYFSGNLSFVNIVEKGEKVIDVIEELLERGVSFKILCRVNLSSINNINLLTTLLKKYPGQIDIKHCYQPLRGYILDDSMARFVNEEFANDYKKGELNQDIRMFCEVYDQDWIAWLRKLYWHLAKTSIDYQSRAKMISKFL